jgi:predicted Ser/Thr protein kinase
MDFNTKQAKVICEFSRGTFSTLYYVEIANQKYALKVLTTPDSQND